MRVLSIVSYKYLPARTGGEIGIADFAEYLSRYCALTVVSVQANRPEGVLPYTLWRLFSDSPLRYANVFYAFPLAKAVRTQQTDLVLIEHPYMGWLALLLRLLTRRRFVIHSRNIEAERFRTIGKWWWPLLKLYEQAVHRAAAYSFFISQEDADAAIQQYGLVPSRVGVATHGITPPTVLPVRAEVRARVVADHGISPEALIYFFNGALGYMPNQQAVRMILTEVYPRLKQRIDFPFVILISGKGLPEELVAQIAATGGDIIYTGFVPSIADYLVAADLFINPVIAGGGVKTKVLEALAYHKTVVSTASGALGVHVPVCGSKLKIAADGQWDDFITLLLSKEGLDSPTPPAYFTYYDNDHIAREAAMVMQQVIS